MFRGASTSSGLQTANVLVTANPAKLTSVVLNPAAAASTLIVYDNNTAAASGTVLAKVVVPASAASVSVVFDSPVVANRGLYCVVTGTAADYVVTYEPA